MAGKYKKKNPNKFKIIFDLLDSQNLKIKLETVGKTARFKFPRSFPVYT